MMNKERELLRQIHYCWVGVDALEDESDPEIKALNEVMREAEHYLFHEKEVDYPFEGWRLREVYFEDGTALMHREPSEPESDEPVAWIRKNGLRFNADIEPDGEEETPLYLRPPAPERKPMTVEDLETLARRCDYENDKVYVDEELCVDSFDYKNL